MGPALRTCFMGRQPFTGYFTTCRRRRVKCDRTEPVCNRCVKAGLECPGYKQVMRMQQHFVGRGGGLIRAPGGVSTLERPEVPRSLSLAGFEGQIAFSFYFRDYRWARPKRILTWNPKLPSFLRLLSRLSSLRWIED